jgi:hypothetical protein
MKEGDLVTINFRFTSTQNYYNEFLEKRTFIITEEVIPSSKSVEIFQLEPADGRRTGESLRYIFLAKYLDLLPEHELCQTLNSVGLL